MVNRKPIWIASLAVATLLGFLTSELRHRMLRKSAAWPTAIQLSPQDTVSTTDWREEYRIQAGELRKTIESRNTSIAAAAKRVDYIVATLEVAEPAQRAVPDLDVKPIVEELRQELLALTKEIRNLNLSNRLDAIEWPLMAGMAGQTNATLDYLVQDHFSDNSLESITLTAE